MTKCAVMAENLTIRINNTSIIANLSFCIPYSSITLISGPSGSGKTTLLKTIAGLIPVVYSRYSISGRIKTLGLKPPQALMRGLVSYIPQDPLSFFISASVKSELRFIKQNIPLLQPVQSKLIHELSDGQKYHLLIFSALSKAKVILLDEPTSHIDPWILQEIMHQLERFCDNNRVVIIVDHRVSLLKKYVDQHIILKGNAWKIANWRIKSPLFPETNNDTTGEVITLRNVSVSFNGNPVLKNINLNVIEKTLASIIGKNGSGKTTLLRVIAGLEKPIKGEVNVCGRIFYIPQSPVYWFSTNTVEDEIKLFRRLWNTDISVKQTLEIFGLKHLIKRNPYALSVGEARRLSLALAYVSGADIILVDEPTLGIDEESKETLKTVLSMMRANRTIVVVTHDIAFGSSFAKVYRLREGRIECYEYL